MEPLPAWWWPEPRERLEDVLDIVSRFSCRGLPGSAAPLPAPYVPAAVPATLQEALDAVDAKLDASAAAAARLVRLLMLGYPEPDVAPWAELAAYVGREDAAYRCAQQPASVAESCALHVLGLWEAIKSGDAEAVAVARERCYAAGVRRVVVDNL